MFMSLQSLPSNINILYCVRNKLCFHLLSVADEMVKIEAKAELKTEKSADRIQINHSGSSKPPPEKKMKTIR